jgi:hypothetical protein
MLDSLTNNSNFQLLEAVQRASRSIHRLHSEERHTVSLTEMVPLLSSLYDAAWKQGYVEEAGCNLVH